MKTFDRAMYAIFLLVLLADGARAQSLVPETVEGTEISGGMVLHAALGRASELHTRVNAQRDEMPVSAVRNVRGFGSQLLSGYQATAKPVRVAHVGPIRNLFDGYDFVVLNVVAPLPDFGAVAVFAESAALQFPRLALVEHLGSPAP